MNIHHKLRAIESAAGQENFSKEYLIRKIGEIFSNYKYNGWDLHPEDFSGKFHRSRIIKYNEDIPKFIHEISYPPRKNAKIQRANFEGNQVFYCSGSYEATCFESDIKPGEKVVLSAWDLVEPVIIIPIGWTDEILNRLNTNRGDSHTLRMLKQAQKAIDSHENQKIAKFFSEKFTQPGEKKSYRITAAIAEVFFGKRDCGIVYPTIPMCGNSENFCFTKKLIDKKIIQVSYVFLFEITGKKYIHDNVYQIILKPIDYADTFYNDEISWKGSVPKEKEEDREFTILFKNQTDFFSKTGLR